jgi:succinate dehydrogenase / fumarate reductase, membrane anchor subunit
MKNNIGSNRLVVGAGYGLGEFLAQRATAVVMVVYTVVLLLAFLTGSNFSYEGWAGLFAQTWFKLFTLATLIGLFYHAWIGVVSIYQDYVKNIAVRFVLHTASAMWLVACAVWSVQILWSV